MGVCVYNLLTIWPVVLLLTYLFTLIIQDNLQWLSSPINNQTILFIAYMPLLMATSAVT